MMLSRGERFEEARRMADKTMDTVSKETGLSKSIIHALENDDKSRDVGISKIVKLASCYNVSADFLLGLSDIASPDITIQEIGKKTGLSEKALNHLQHFNNNDSQSGGSAGFAVLTNHEAMELVNSFLGHPKLGEFIYNINASVQLSRFQIPESASGKDIQSAEEAASHIGGVVLSKEDAVRHFRQEAINNLRDIVYYLVPEEEK